MTDARCLLREISSTAGMATESAQQGSAQAAQSRGMPWDGTFFDSSRVYLFGVCEMFCTAKCLQTFDAGRFGRWLRMMRKSQDML